MNIIVSGASQGIGFQTALRFAEKGHHLLAIARTETKLQKLKNKSNQIEILAADLLDSSLKEKVMNKINAWDKVDVLLNNAGQLINCPFEDTTPSDFLAQYQSNVISAVNLTQAVSEKLTKGSHIINISSMGGFQGSSKFPGLSAYSSAKAALCVLSECMAEEYKSRGIRVNALALGAVKTEMLKKAFPEYEPPVSAEQMADYLVDFAIKGGAFYNGKILPLALSNP